MSLLITKRTLSLFVFLCCLSAFAADSSLATITGRVFDIYHRPVRGARVATMVRQTVAGQDRIVAQTSAVVDDAGMYRLSLAPGRYILAALPPLRALDFPTVFPAYFQDTVEFDQARPVDLTPGELRPFVDFLLLDVEGHRLEGEVTGIPPSSGAVSVALSRTQGYLEPLEVTVADAQGNFHFDHVPAGVYDLRAVLAAGTRSAPVRVEVRKPEIRGIQIHLRGAAR
jgi:hypothetical protein